MIRNHNFINIILITLVITFLTISVGKVTPVYALADPVPITAVYDTQIIQLADYVDHLPEPSVDLFYILTGVLAAAQLGGQEFKLEDPYANSSDVIDWFKSMGLRFYNTMIGLAPNVDPVLGFDMRPYIKPLVAAVMGNAVMARNYGNIDDFMASEDQVVMPFKKDIQTNINRIWQLTGGPYDWQFAELPFTSDFNLYTSNMTQGITNNMFNYLDHGQVVVRGNYIFFGSYRYNFHFSSTAFVNYHNLFFDESNGRVYLMDDHGNKYTRSDLYYAWTNDAGTELSTDFVYTNLPMLNYDENGSYTQSTLLTAPTYKQAVIDFFNSVNQTSIFPYWSDFIQHVYIGTNWLNKHEIFNLTDLNISNDGNDYYYNEVQDDVLIDIKNLINDLVNTTDIWDTIINNIYNPDGTQIVNPPTIKVSVDLTPITDLLDPPVPVNLNDIAELTENTYLERVKEHARNAGDIFANYVAFWHNCDSDLVYTMFGAVILVLIGAFVGKWGHS